MCCGWAFWETLPGLMIEAEFHAVWRAPSGRLVDVTTPQSPETTQVEFLVDPSIEYDGRQIDNVRYATTGDPLVREFIRLCEAFFEATNRGSLAYADRYTATPEIRQLLSDRQRLEAEIYRSRYGMSSLG